jgi:hypothetical protein
MLEADKVDYQPSRATPRLIEERNRNAVGVGILAALQTLELRWPHARPMRRSFDPPARVRPILMPSAT